MIGYRTMFCCLPLFLTLVVIVSSAPILDLQLVSTQLGQVWVNGTVPVAVVSTTHDYDDHDSSDEDLQTTTTTTSAESPEETTSYGQLSVGAADVPLDINEILKLTERLFSAYDGELPSTPTTESPEDDDDDDDDDE